MTTRFVSVASFSLMLLIASTGSAAARQSDSSVPGRPVAPGSEPHSAETSSLTELSGRVSSLEAGRQDLGAWANLLVGAMTLLLAANVGLSVWQVGAMARRETAGAIEEYDQRFNGFLSKGEETIRTALAANERRFQELATRLAQVAAVLDTHSATVRAAIEDITSSTERTLQDARIQSERAIADLERAFGERLHDKSSQGRPSGD